MPKGSGYFWKISAWAVAISAASLLALRVHVDTSADLFLDRHSEKYSFYEYSKSLFGGDESLVFVVGDGHGFTDRDLTQLEVITRRLSQTPGIRRVDSVHSFPMILASPDGSLRLDPAANIATDVHELRELVVSDRVQQRYLISDDGRKLAAVAILEGDAKNFEEIVGVADSLANELGGVISGVPKFRVEANAKTRRDLTVFVPLALVVIAILTAIAFYSPRASLLALTPGAVGSVAIAAVAAVTGIPLGLLSVPLPAIILALGAAYSMHLLSADPAESLQHLKERVRTPMLYSGITTFVAFSSIATIDVAAVTQVGILGSIGVLGATAAAAWFVPLVMEVWRPQRLRVPTTWVSRVCIGLSSLAKSNIVLVGWVLVALTLAWFIGSLTVRTDVTDWFPRGTPPRDNYDQIRQEFSGISPVNIVISGAHGQSVADPSLVAAIDNLARHLELKEEVGKSLAVSDALRKLNGGFKGDPSEPLPSNRAEIEQYLLLLDSVRPLRDVITADGSHASISLRVDDNGSDALQSIAGIAESWWKENGVEGFEARGTGIMYEFARAEDKITEGILRGTGIAAFVIFVLCAGVFRSVRATTVLMIANLVPILIVFGGLGLSGIHLDVGTVVVGCLALGVAVDDSFHILFGYLRSDGNHGVERICEALRNTLSPIVTSTALVVSGFLVLTISNFTLTRHLGALMSLAMVVCLLSNLTLLPALLLRLPLPRWEPKQLDAVKAQNKRFLFW